MFGTFKFSNEEFESVSAFNTRKIIGSRFIKNNVTGFIQLGMIFNNADILAWLYKDWKDQKEKAALISAAIAKLAIENAINPLSPDEYGLIIRPEGIEAYEKVVTNSITGDDTVSTRQFLPTEEILMIDRDITKGTFLFFMIDEREELVAISWNFKSSTEFLEFNKTFTTNQVTILTIEM